jgi:hypothetical protein
LRKTFGNPVSLWHSQCIADSPRRFIFFSSTRASGRQQHATAQHSAEFLAALPLGERAGTINAVPKKSADFLGH